LLVGQVGNLRPIGNRPSDYSAQYQADCQSAAGCHPAPHDQNQSAVKQRMKTADERRLVSTEKARQRIQQWLSKSSTTKTH
jgi:hypothetical protein